MWQQAAHCVPVAQMGDYHEVLRRRSEPRDPHMDDEEAKVGSSQFNRDFIRVLKTTTRASIGSFKHQQGFR